MSSLNKAQIIGNITKDPELKSTQLGHNVCSVGVATNRKWTNKQTGQIQEEVEFHNIVAWGKLAEIICQYLRKGAKVYFDGRLKTRSWEDSDGKKNYRTEIVAENMIMLGGKPVGENQSPTATAQPASVDEVNVEDLPF